jgi:hypothetical protein
MPSFKKIKCISIKDFVREARFKRLIGEFGDGFNKNLVI